MMLLRNYFAEVLHETRAGWDRFWFTPADPAAVSLIRILAGAMLLYTHAVWTLDLAAFFGPHAWLSPEALRALQPEGWQWTPWLALSSPAAMWTLQVAGLTVLLLLTLGLWTRTTSILAYLFTVACCHRTPLALYGLDQINTYLALYLALAPCGARYSLDARLRRRRGRAEPPASVSANIATRLMQIHLCLLYLFAGLSKLQGPAWWDGTAFWGAVANLEYQSIDLTWLVRWPVAINVLTHATIFWEVGYCVLIWPRLWRPLMLALALPVHLGIGLALGMPTFGLVMLIANVAFVSPNLVRRLVERRAASGTDVPQETPAQPRRRVA